MPLSARAQLLASRRAKGIRRRPKLPRQAGPEAIDGEYATKLLRYARLAREVLAPLLAELPDLLERAAAARADDARRDADEGKRIRELAAQAAKELAAKMKPAELERVGRAMAKRTSTFQRAQLQKQARRAMGVDLFLMDRQLPAIVEGFVAENAALIKDVPARVVTEVEQMATRAVASGRRHEEIAAELEERFGISENRAKLIARDQVGKLYGQINASRQKEVGIERFIWRTSNDERVRDEHRELEAESEAEPFSYDDPPSEGLPGEPINCRCHAEPVFEELEDE